jgi:signal transduction histidine kinase
MRPASWPVLSSQSTTFFQLPADFLCSMLSGFLVWPETLALSSQWSLALLVAVFSLSCMIAGATYFQLRIRKLTAERDQAVATHEQKTEFVSFLAHEIRNPVLSLSCIGRAAAAVAHKCWHLLCSLCGAVARDSRHSHESAVCPRPE